MLKAAPNRTYTFTRLLFTLAFVICGIAWLRFFAAAVTNPSPVRYMAFEIEDETRDPFQQECVGPSFIEADTVWRYCQYAPSGTEPDPAAQWGFVRFDLAAGIATLRWPLPVTPDTQILAFASSSAGPIAVAWGAPNLETIYLLDRARGATALSVPAEVDHVAGLAWTTDGGLELATATTTGDLLIFAHNGDPVEGDWILARELNLSPCDEDGICAFQVARYDDARGWEAVIASAAQTFTDPRASTVTFTLIDESPSSQVIGNVTLNELDPASYSVLASPITPGETISQMQLTRLSPLFDRSPGNVVNWQIDTAPFILADGNAQRLTVPSTNASFYFSNYEIMGSRLRWIPGLRYPSFGWYMENWMTLQAGENGVALAYFDGKGGDTLTTNITFIKQNSQTCVLPASGGGYWVLGPSGAYLKADTSMARADSMTLWERIEHTITRFSRFHTVSDDFYRQQRALKMAAFPLILFSLPVGYLLVFFVRQTRKNRRAWVILLLQVSAIYLILAAVFFWWFWELMGDF